MVVHLIAAACSSLLSKWPKYMLLILHATPVSVNVYTVDMVLYIKTKYSLQYGVVLLLTDDFVFTLNLVNYCWQY